MAEFSNYKAQTLVAGGDMSALQYHIVKVTDGLNKIGIATAGDDNTIAGVLITTPKAEGRNASVAYEGHVKVVAGAPINSAHVWLTSNSSGRAVAATPGSGHVVIGKALSTAPGNGVVIPVLAQHPFVLV